MTPTPFDAEQAAWQAFLKRQCSRSVLDGVVTKVVPFGAFVELDQGVTGLIHCSEWQAEQAEPTVGAAVTVRILDLDLDNRRVSLKQV